MKMGIPSSCSSIFQLTDPVSLRTAYMSNLAQNEPQSAQGSVRPRSTPSHRRRHLRVLFVHRDADAIDRCLQELKKEQFTVSYDKARLSGRGFYDDHGNFAGREIIAIDVTEQRMLEDRLRHQASSDSLTGLANHRGLFEVLHAEICRSQRTEREFSLVLLDLDGLKNINDRFGHLVGNRALCRLGRILADCCRSMDTVARHGGDEFAVVLPETGMAAATLVGRRICDLLAKDTEDPTLSVSIGVASYPQGADTLATIIYEADKALYVMKSKKPCLARAAHASFSP
jgi:diguanylate cyclase (GGDEF)-like protein